LTEKLTVDLYPNAPLQLYATHHRSGSNSEEATESTEESDMKQITVT
jgi:hypothetical protein